jgi:hypothetical protein
MLMCCVAGMAKDAALCFFKAMRVYPQPKELMKVCCVVSIEPHDTS